MPTLDEIRVSTAHGFTRDHAPDFSLSHGAVCHQLWSILNRARAEAKCAPTEGPDVKEWLRGIEEKIETAIRLVEAAR